jgi:hypothetical protein
MVQIQTFLPMWIQQYPSGICVAEGDKTIKIYKIKY